MQLKLLDISRALSEAELKTLFAEYGKVTSCTIVKDSETGASKGFGFVEFEDETSAQNAMEALHKKKIKGSRLRVKAADNKN